MIEQYPHSITITKQPTLLQDETGNYFQSSSGDVYTYDCRIEPAGSNPVIRGTDGNEINFQFIVYMASTSVQFSFGDSVTITLTNGSQFNGFVKQQYNGQLNSRLWV